MDAELLLHRKFLVGDGVVEMVIWRLPSPDRLRPHGLKYRLYFGHGGRCLVRYDNESGKGDHRHIGRRETPYSFRDIDTLIADFLADVETVVGRL